MSEAMIEVRNSRKVYGDHTAVDDMSFTASRSPGYRRKEPIMRAHRFAYRRLSVLGFALLALILAACLPRRSEVGSFTVESEVVSEQTATYEDEDVGFALDYPASWYLLKTQPEDKQSRGYLASFSSWPLTPESGEILEGETRFDVTVLRWEPLDLAQFVASRKSAWEAAGLTILSEESWVLANKLEATRFLVNTADEGTVFFLFTLIGDRFVSLSGTGDLELLGQIGRTLRPIGASDQ